ncbi:DEAD/DEAH box helicase [archaeon]|nr:DEAD/DEAH box helicase [archaeon]MBT6868525.1 DEAD/DEAH box helicase [archaeon]MBT7381148.1 DEAD/DEAH box helicase [archaeon]MBT7507499.1 DEAD/DEAH box helicase [archaeon]
MKYKGLTLDPFQENSIKSIEKGHSVVVSAPTGSGKTLIADYIIDTNKNKPNRIIYTAPIKALSNQKFKDFSKDYGEENIGLMTGDIVINPHAKVLIMTTEIYRNMVMTGDKSVANVVYVIFDEVHYVNDIERGYVWEESVIYSPENTRFLCLSATIPNAEEFARWIQAIKKHEVDTITSDFRVVPLKHSFYDYEAGIVTLNKLKKFISDAKNIPRYEQIYRRRGKGGRKLRTKTPEPNHIELIKDLYPDKVPCLFFSFSRKDCQEKAKELNDSELFPKDKFLISYIAQAMKGWPTEVRKLRSTVIQKNALARGIAFHHAGLLPRVKSLVEDLFSQGKIKVLYATETFAVGINMPAKTVCFNSLRKFDGINFRDLNTKEYFQIAGRAGRRGIDEVGYVVSMIYRPAFNYYKLKKLTYKDVEPIKSQFKLSINTVLNLINRHDTEEIERILKMSFYSYQLYGDEYEEIASQRLIYRYNKLFKKLKKYGFIGDDDKLTEKGLFSTRIFVDEITLGEMFSGDFYKDLSDYQILLVLAALVYEGRERTEFKKIFRNKELSYLRTKLKENPRTSREKKFESLDKVTALIYPLFKDQTFFDLMKNTNLLEGDLIRFFGQVLDRIGQIRKASSDSQLPMRMDSCEAVIMKSLEEIYGV